MTRYFFFLTFNPMHKISPKKIAKGEKVSTNAEQNPKKPSKRKKRSLANAHYDEFHS